MYILGNTFTLSTNKVKLLKTSYKLSAALYKVWKEDGWLTLSTHNQKQISLTTENVKNCFSHIITPSRNDFLLSSSFETKPPLSTLLRSITHSRNTFIYVFQVFSAVVVQITVFWALTTCNVINLFWRFEGKFCHLLLVTELVSGGRWNE